MNAKQALLIVDVQNDFCPGGALAVPRGNMIIPKVNNYMQVFAAYRLPIFASRDWHPKKTTHFKEYGGLWPKHCVQNTNGALFHPHLRLPKEAIVISKGVDPKKNGYSAFEGVDAKGQSLFQLLKNLGIKELFICGLATDYCVKASVLEALKKGFVVHVLSDAVQGVNIKPKDSLEAIHSMIKAGADKITFSKIRNFIKKERKVLPKHFFDSSKIDLYELTMAAGYFENRLNLKATFELSCHTMPQNRPYLICCGLEQVVQFILNSRFSPQDTKFLKTVPAFKNINRSFFSYLRKFKFTGDVWAMPEGEIFFAGEPILQVEAPIIEAQILETYILSMMNLQSLIATKASRVVGAASFDGIQRGVIDFGSRRAHGIEAAILAARASYIGGCLGTSNVYAGRKFGIPLYGTIAHSWIEAFDTEEESFEKYYKVFPDNTILLVDTYDTIEAVKKIAKLKFKNDIKGIRLDSGDLIDLSQRVRKILDSEGLQHIKIISSGNLNEYKIYDLVKNKSPIDFFGVGTDMVTSRDWPALDLTYKLVQITDKQGNVKYKAKQSPQKETIPGRKQIFRRYTKGGLIEKDIIGLFTEKPPEGSKPLLKEIIKSGQLVKPLPTLDSIREYRRGRLSQLPLDLLSVHATRSEYKVELSERLAQLKV